MMDQWSTHRLIEFQEEADSFMVHAIKYSRNVENIICMSSEDWAVNLKRTPQNHNLEDTLSVSIDYIIKT